MDVSGLAKLNFKAVVYMKNIDFYNKSMKRIRTQAYRKKIGGKMVQYGRRT